MLAHNVAHVSLVQAAEEVRRSGENLAAAAEAVLCAGAVGRG